MNSEIAPDQRACSAVLNRARRERAGAHTLDLVIMIATVIATAVAFVGPKYHHHHHHHHQSTLQRFDRNRITACTTERDGSGTAARQAVQELGRWIDEQGGNSGFVVGGPTQYGLGLLATSDLKRGDVLVSVPKHCQLSVANTLESSPGMLASVHEAVPADFWAARLALMLLAERGRGEASPFAKYVSTLPAKYTVPLFWTPEAVGHLAAYPTAQRRLLKTAKFINSFASEELAKESAAEGCFSGYTVGADAFGWAIAACSSRAFMVGGGARVMCPLIDIGNHAPSQEANCEVKGSLGGALELVARRDIALGEEVTFCYGKELSNDDFLLDYGFIPSANEHDDTLLAWGDGALLDSARSAASLDGPLAEWQRAALRSFSSKEHVRITRSGVDADALHACRIVAASDAAVLRTADGGKKPLPAGGEVKAMKLAAGIAAIALAAFPEPVPHEAEEPQTEDVGTPLARRFLDGKREVCAQALSHLGSRIKALQSGGAKAELRGITKAKKASGVRKRSASRGGASAKKPAAGGFG